MSDDHKEIIKDTTYYDERLRFWTEQALNQFGTASNFFFLISFGFLAFLFKNDQVKNLFRFEGESIDFSLLLLGLSILCSVVSLLASAITVLSRLYDLRITRHIIWTRKRYYDRTSCHLPDDFIDIDKFSTWDHICNFKSSFKSKSYIITDVEIDRKDGLIEKFLEVKKRNLLLSRFSWWSMSIQILALVIALFFYLISLSI